ncbi:hypothetical protein TPHV1_100015 [Treponema phagedenis]|uniref:Uncharacterized protein n=1 Tax=Treponema phagedenis TaxID=162 RepID=A0A0B7GUQ4_TREPH|nr:hypothetical protein TPHV1_100015 [Treponema phagedenis]
MKINRTFLQTVIYNIESKLKNFSKNNSFSFFRSFFVGE